MRRISLFIVINAISLYIVSVLMKSVYIGSLASLITQIFTNVIMGFIIKPIRRNNKLMFQALNPKCVIELMRKVKR